MKTLCSFCQIKMPDLPPLDSNAITHGICKPCYKHFIKQAKGLSLSEYLSDHDFPIFVINKDRRVIAANQAFLDISGRTHKEIIGLRGGEVFTCAHARVLGGCGSNIHCKSCTTRLITICTFADGKPRYRVPATLDTSGRGLIKFLISAELLPARIMRITIENIEDADMHDIETIDEKSNKEILKLPREGVE